MKNILEQRFNRYKIYAVNIFICFWLLALFIPIATSQSLFDENSYGNELYQDITARKVGDTIRVVILQNAQADQSTETNRRRQGDLEASYTAGGAAGQGVELGGQTSRSNSRRISREINFVATVTAQVIEVLPNGNLRIEGHQYTSINDQRTEISVAGIINKADIAPDNSVSSSALADAKIEYSEPLPEENKVVSIIAFPFRLIGKILKFIF